MAAFLMAMGYIIAFLIGGYASFRISEHYNSIIRSMRPRPVRREPDIFEVKKEEDGQ